MKRRPDTTLQLQLARPRDFAALYAILVERSAWLRARGVDQWATPYPEGRFRDELARGLVYAGSEGARLVATITLSPTPPDYYPPAPWSPVARAWYLSRFAVALREEHRALGERLLARIEEAARVQSIGALRLDIVATNLFLKDYYQRLGYTVVAECVMNREQYLLLEKRVAAETR